MADEESAMKECERPEDLEFKESQPTSPSPCNKRPFTKYGQENEKMDTKRTKCDNLDAEDKVTTPQHVENNVKQTTSTENKRELTMILKKKQDTLRKLNLVKMYRAKNNLTDLEELITKWRSLSQTAAQDLYDKFSKDNKLISMGQFLDGMRVSHDLIKYSEEEETFL